MKILPVSLIREADQFTITHEPIADIDLMERASTRCFERIATLSSEDQPVRIFCGTGNNGGDGLAITRMLLERGRNVKVFLAGSADKMTPSCKTNYLRLPEGFCTILDPASELPKLTSGDLVIDAIIGNGLTSAASGFAATVIEHINASKATIVSIDVPSGLLCDSSMKELKNPAVVHADHTLSFSPAKLAFFFPENEFYLGRWELLDIGILPAFTDQVSVANYMVEHGDVVLLLHKRGKFTHKGTYGHSLLFCGSVGKMGAAVLSAKGCLRSGAGLVSVHIPAGEGAILQSAVPEAMLSIDKGEYKHFSSLPGLEPYNAIGIGPGIGTEDETARALKLLIQECRKPLVIDADAINILAENRTWLGFLPTHTVFTPHPKEFERLVGKADNDFTRNQMQRDFSVRFRCYVVLKGAHTAVTTPEGACYFNTTGNPGMATGGSGDVLTGIITGLLAQGYSALEACLLGVYIHGLAGDFALTEQGFEALIAGDIINKIGNAFQTLYGKL